MIVGVSCFDKANISQNAADNIFVLYNSQGRELIDPGLPIVKAPCTVLLHTASTALNQ